MDDWGGWMGDGWMDGWLDDLGGWMGDGWMGGWYEDCYQEGQAILVCWDGHY